MEFRINVIKLAIFCLVLLNLNAKANNKIKYLAIKNDFSVTSQLSENIFQQIFESGFQDNQDLIAVCSYENSLNESGWYLLQIKTDSFYSDSDQAYAGGKCEGYISQQQIYDAYVNFFDEILKKKILNEQAQDFINNQLLWLRSMVKLQRNKDYWQIVGLFLQQLDGMYAGYKEQQEQQQNETMFLSFEEFYYLTNMGDLEDVEVAFRDQVEIQRGECNAFIRLTEQDLFSAHSTFNNYALMLRIYKVYEFNYQNQANKHNRVQFSSRPGDLESKDDWYIFDNLVSMETSLNNNNKTNFQFMHTNSVPCWLRCQVANKMATNGQEWVNLFSKYRSGTHNSQWFVVDYNAFRNYQKNSSNSKDIVWIAEEFFFYYWQNDITFMLLEQGYIAGYNAAMNETIFQVQDVDKRFNYTNSYRYKLFKEHYKEGSSFNGMGQLLYTNLNLTGYPCGVPPTYLEATEIAIRCDYLVETVGKSQFFGLIDGKFLNNDLISSGSSFIKCGPTRSGFPDYFNWKNFNETISHQGQPDLFKFNWQFLNSTSNNKPIIMVDTNLTLEEKISKIVQK